MEGRVRLQEGDAGGRVKRSLHGAVHAGQKGSEADGPGQGSDSGSRGWPAQWGLEGQDKENGHSWER